MDTGNDFLMYLLRLTYRIIDQSTIYNYDIYESNLQNIPGKLFLQNNL